MITIKQIKTLKNNFIEMKIVWWLITILLSILYIPTLIIYSIGFMFTLTSEKCLSYTNLLRYKIIQIYSWVTRMPHDGKRGHLRFIDMHKILKSFPKGAYKAEVYDPIKDKLITIDLRLEGSGVIHSFSHFNKLDIENIHTINGLNVRELLK